LILEHFPDLLLHTFLRIFSEKRRLQKTFFSGRKKKLKKYVLCINKRSSAFYMGLTGFDGMCRLRVSMSGVGRTSCEKFFQTLIGESNYALAA